MRDEAEPTEVLVEVAGDDGDSLVEQEAHHPGAEATGGTGDEETFG